MINTFNNYFHPTSMNIRLPEEKRSSENLTKITSQNILYQHIVPQGIKHCDLSWLNIIHHGNYILP